MPSNKKRHALARQWELLQRLPTRGAGKTASELTRELREAGFEVSKRQVERDLGELLDAFALDCNNSSVPYGWRWAPGAGADLPGLTLADALSLSLVEDMLRQLLPGSLLTGLAPRFRQARTKLEDLASKNSTANWINKVRTVQPTQPLRLPQIDTEVLHTVQECLLADETIDATYRAIDAGEATRLRLHPLGLLHRGQITYLVATAWNYPDARLYAMHRLTGATRTYEPCRKPSGFDLDQYAQSGAGHFGSGKALFLEAKVSEGLTRILRETPLSADQTIHGSALTATVLHTWQLEWWILGHGDQIEIVGPEWLRSSIADKLLRAAARYGRNHDSGSTPDERPHLPTDPKVTA